MATEPWVWWNDDFLLPEEPQTRPSSHPDGFSFLQPHADAFWKKWLAFTSDDLGRLGFARWLWATGKLREW